MDYGYDGHYHWLNKEKTLQLQTKAVEDDKIKFVIYQFFYEFEPKSMELIGRDGITRWRRTIYCFRVEDDTAIKIARDLLRDYSLNKFGSG